MLINIKKKIMTFEYDLILRSFFSFWISIQDQYWGLGFRFGIGIGDLIWLDLGFGFRFSFWIGGWRLWNRCRDWD